MLLTAVSFTSGGQESAKKSADPMAGNQSAKNAALEKKFWHTHRHIQLENNIPFPRSIQMEEAAF